MEELRADTLKDLEREHERERDQLAGMRIQMEIDRITESDLAAAPAGEEVDSGSVDLFGQPADQAPETNGAWTEFTLRPSFRGARNLGRIEAGQTLLVKYISGNWDGIHPVIMKANPRIKLATIPPSTSSQPFTWTARASSSIVLKNAVNATDSTSDGDLVLAYQIK